jgi:uncharacterized protein YfeS
MKLRVLILLIFFFNFFCLAYTNDDFIELSDTSSSNNYGLLKQIDKIGENDYNNLLDRLKKFDTTDYFSLRIAYTKTNNYNPYSVSDNDLFELIYSELDSSHFNEAIKNLNKILETNFVNIKAHLISGFVYKKLKDTALSELNYHIYDGLINSIYKSGDGINTKTAFIVINASEEYALLGKFGLKSNGQELISKDGHAFDLIKATDKKTGKEYEFYFNIDIPYNPKNFK